MFLCRNNYLCSADTPKKETDKTKKNMKRMRIQSLAMLLLCLLMAIPASAKKAKVSNAQRVEYVLKNLEVKKDVKTRLKPLLENYLKDKDATSTSYDKMKDKLKPKIKLGTISDEQGQQLLDAKWAAEAKELQVKKQYEQTFKTVMPVKKVYECFRLLNDKNSKILNGDDDD